MSRICLIQCSGGETGKPDAPPVSTYNVAEPLGLLCLDAWLRIRGHEILLLHPNIEANAFLSDAEMIHRAISFKPDLIGFSAMTNQMPATVRLARRLKAGMPEVPIVIGGDHFSSHPRDLTAYAMFDFAVCGEGEGAIVWLLENAHLPSSLRSPTPSGIYGMENDQGWGSGRAQRIADLGLVPPPTRYPGLLRSGEVGMLMWPPPSQQTGMMSLYASRGCPYSCSYCNARLIWGKGVGWRDPVCVVEEMRKVRDTYGVNTAFFVDLTFNADLNRAHALCDALAEANLGISWYVLARPGNPQDRIRVDHPLLKAMQRAGCVKIGFGVETVSPTVAHSLGRVCGNEYVVQLARWMDELGIISKAFLIIGHPAEDEHYYDCLSNYLDELGVDEIRLSFLTPFPGTPLWEIHKHELPGRNDYDKFTTFRPILPHPQFSTARLEEIRVGILRRFYSSPHYLSRVSEKIKLHPHLQEAFDFFHKSIRSQIGWIKHQKTGTIFQNFSIKNLSRKSREVCDAQIIGKNNPSSATKYASAVQ
jgi:radical SAM superfamily enzyme YgiQ (UPF0313 family)